MKHKIILSSFIALCAMPVFAQSTRNQLNNVAGQSQRATHQTSSEGARAGASSGYDTRAPSNTAANLGTGTTPGLLRNTNGTNPYSPYEGRPIRTTPPPPLR